MGPRSLWFLVRMVGRLSVHDADVSRVDVLVPGRQAGNALARHVLLHAAEGIVRRELLVNDVSPEDKCHLVRHKHSRSLVRVIVVDDVLGLEWVVFGVFASSSVPGVRNRGSRRPAVVFPSPGLVPESVFCGELPECDPASGPDELVPVGGKDLPLLKSQECSGYVLCDILSHGVLSSWQMFWLCRFHLTRDCDAFVFFPRDAPMGAFLSSLSLPLSIPVLFLQGLFSPP